jgi:type II secretory pathway pseudopilin PulG
MMRLSRPQLLAGLLALVVVVAVVAGIVVVGSPAEQRTQRLDERRVGDLASIAQAADLYWTRHAQLPTSLNELTIEPGTRLRANDPETNAPYEYQRLDASSFEVCAQFQRQSQQDSVAEDRFWLHGTGRQCFRRKARTVD